MRPSLLVIPVHPLQHLERRHVLALRQSQHVNVLRDVILFERVLQDLVVLCHLEPLIRVVIHARQVHGPRVNCIDDLAIRRAIRRLLNFLVIDAQKVVEPIQQLAQGLQRRG